MSNCYQCIQKNKVIADLKNKLKISDAACDGMAERWRETEGERDRVRELARVAVAGYARWVVPHYGAVDGLDALGEYLEANK